MFLLEKRNKKWKKNEFKMNKDKKFEIILRSKYK